MHSPTFSWLGLALALLLAAGCVSPATPGTGTSGPAAGTAGFSLDPALPSTQPANVQHLAFVAQLKDAAGKAWPTGSGNYVLGDYVFGSALAKGFFIADVRDPAHPAIVYNTTADSETPYARKAEVLAHPDGRRTLVLASGGKGIVNFWDVSDPRHPEFRAKLDVKANNHNVAVVPGTELVFNAPSSGGGGPGGTSSGVAKNDLIDAHDPANPVSLGRFGEWGCHGITFHGRLGEPKFRAYCAGVGATQVWDLDHLDVKAPNFGIKVLATIAKADNPAIGAGGLHHLAAGNADGTVLIIGDEFSGGGQPGACLAYDPTTGASTPLGALWFYDLANEAAPVLKGHLSPPTMLPESPPGAGPVPAPTLPVDPFDDTPGAGCTAHFGTLVPGEQKFVIAWYNAGVLLVDFTDPAAPVLLDQYRNPGINTWNARVSIGYVFTGDIGRGMDVLKLA
ncbi:MAG: hypothetical protein QOI63_30 [Thermoplasmata archaeon]|nr:hypothetical protein [Thermoplasmata archaeon]